MWLTPLISAKVHFPLVFVIILFPLSTFLVVLSLASLPVTVSWPRTLEDLAAMGKDLHAYSQSGTWPLAHVVGVLSVSAVWKHAWSVPGSVAWVGGFRAFYQSPSAESFFFSVRRMYSAAPFSTLHGRPCSSRSSRRSVLFSRHSCHDL